MCRNGIDQSGIGRRAASAVRQSPYPACAGLCDQRSSKLHDRFIAPSEKHADAIDEAALHDARCSLRNTGGIERGDEFRQA
ncbi:MAG: hypothetical protein AMXMBFR52_10290 [Burkholderiales bacterium]